MPTPATVRPRTRSRSLRALVALGTVVVLSGCGVASVSTPNLGRLTATTSAQNLIAAQTRKPFSGVIYKAGSWLGYSSDNGADSFASKSAKGADGVLQRQLVTIQQAGKPDPAALAKAVRDAGTADKNGNYLKIADAITQLAGSG